MTDLDRHPLVVFGDDWGRSVSTMQHLFRHVIPRHPVVWVNALGHRVPRIARTDCRRALEKVGAMMGAAKAPDEATAAPVTPHAIVFPRVLPWHHVRTVRHLNGFSLARAIRHALETIDARRAPVVVTGSPPSVAVLGQLGEVGVIYLCMDDFLHTPGTSPSMLAPLELELLERADAVVATALTLTERKIPKSGRTHYLPQGVNFALFATPRAEPPELSRIRRPIIGFAGGLYPRCDLDLIGGLADSCPEAAVVLVGPVAVDTSRLRRPNVHLLGPRPYAALPAYVQRFDVGIVPYLLNEETEAVDPLKLLEYLAAGVPTVSTAIPEARKYEPVVTVAPDRSSFVTGVRRILASDRSALSERSREVARANTWQTRAERLMDIIAEVVRSKNGGEPTG